MPAIANLVLADSVPANRTFAPLGVSSDLVATFENRSVGIQVGYDMLSLGFRRSNGKSHNNKVTLKLTTPTLEVTSPSTMTGIQPQPTQAYACACFIDFVLPDRCSALERANLLALVKSALAHANVAAMINNLESSY